MQSLRLSAIDRLNVAFNTRDVEAFMADATADFEIESRFSSVQGRVFRGREGVIAWWADLAEVWDPMHLELQDCADVRTNRTLILAVLRGIGQGSGLHLAEPIAQRWYWRSERLSKIEYLDRLEAEAIIRGQQA